MKKAQYTPNKALLQRFVAAASGAAATKRSWRKCRGERGVRPWRLAWCEPMLVEGFEGGGAVG